MRENHAVPVHQAPSALLNSETHNQQRPLPESTIELRAQFEALQLRLKQATYDLEAEQKKRQQAEAKERSALIHQSQTAKKQNEVENENTKLKQQIGVEKRLRTESESRAVNHRKVFGIFGRGGLMSRERIVIFIKD